MCLERQTSESLIENWGSVEMMVLIFTLSASSAFKAMPMRALGEEVKRQQELGQSRMVKIGWWEEEEVKNGAGSKVKLQMNTEVLLRPFLL